MFKFDGVCASIQIILNEGGQCGINARRSCGLDFAHVKESFLTSEAGFSKKSIFAAPQQSNMLFRHNVSEHFRVFFWPCRGPLAARWRPLMAGARKERDVSL